MQNVGLIRPLIVSARLCLVFMAVIGYSEAARAACKTSREETWARLESERASMREGWKIVDADPAKAMEIGIELVRHGSAEVLPGTLCLTPRIFSPDETQELRDDANRIQRHGVCLKWYVDVSRTQIALDQALAEFERLGSSCGLQAHDAVIKALQEHVWALTGLLDPNSNGCASRPRLVDVVRARQARAQALYDELTAPRAGRGCLDAARLRERLGEPTRVPTEVEEGDAKRVSSGAPRSVENPLDSGESNAQPDPRPAPTAAARALTELERANLDGLRYQAGALRRLFKSGDAVRERRSGKFEWLSLETRDCDWTFVRHERCAQGGSESCFMEYYFTVPLRELSQADWRRNADGDSEVQLDVEPGRLRCRIRAGASGGYGPCAEGHSRVAMRFASRKAATEAVTLVKNAWENCKGLE